MIHIALTTGEPAGIGPEISQKAAQEFLAQHPDVSARLLIGNSAYNDWEWPSLKNAVNDIDYVCAAFAKAGISPRIVRNANMVTLDAALTRFAAEAAGASSVVIYYAGHGLQVDSNNLLLGSGSNPTAPRKDLISRSLVLQQKLLAALPPRPQGRGRPATAHENEGDTRDGQDPRRRMARPRHYFNRTRIDFRS